jgi:hypothetical protein
VDGFAHRHEHPDRFARGSGDPRTHRREDLNGLRPDRVLQDPASGEEGG